MFTAASKKLISFISLVIIICPVVALSAQNSSSKPSSRSSNESSNESFRVAAYLPEHSRSISQVIAPWLDQIEKNSQGKISFQRFWGGSLGRGPNRQVLLLEGGVTDIAFIFPGMTPGRFSDLQILEVPLLVQSATEGAVLAWTLYDEGYLRGFENMQVLGFYTVSPATLFSVENIPSITSLSPLKIRSIGPVQADFVESLGGLPETLDAASVSDALRRGTIDGLIQGWTGLETFRQYKQTNYFLDLPAGVLTFAIAMNRNRWNALTEQSKDYFLESGGHKFALTAGATFDREAARIREYLVADGHLQELPANDTERSEFESKSDVIIEKWIDKDSHKESIRKRSIEILKAMRR